MSGSCIMKCKDCPHFKVAAEPFGYEWGLARCMKYDLVTDFKNHRKLNRLTCDDRPERGNNDDLSELRRTERGCG